MNSPKSKVKKIADTIKRARNAKETMCRVPFKIECEFQAAKNLNEMERYCMDKDALEAVTDNDMLFMLITTTKDKYQCRARRGAFNALFRAIKELGVEIEF